MIKNLYSVYDSKAKTFCNPFVSQNDQTALRDFAYAANDVSTPIGQHPTDYSLFRLASFDDESGFVLTDSSASNLAIASTLIRGDL